MYKLSRTGIVNLKNRKKNWEILKQKEKKATVSPKLQ